MHVRENQALAMHGLKWPCVAKALPIGFAQLPNVQNSSRRHPLSLGIFGTPYTDANVSTSFARAGSSEDHHASPQQTHKILCILFKRQMHSSLIVSEESKRMPS